MTMSGSPPPWVVVVVRAWSDPDGTRIRLLCNDSDGGRAEQTTRSPNQAGLTVEQWLDPLRRDPRRADDAGVDGASLDSADDHGRHS
jgi:hypothetical protein